MKFKIKYTNTKFKKYYQSAVDIFIYIILGTQFNLIYTILVISRYKINSLAIY